MSRTPVLGWAAFTSFYPEGFDPRLWNRIKSEFWFNPRKRSQKKIRLNKRRVNAYNKK